jgi:hypothetical protein
MAASPYGQMLVKRGRGVGATTAHAGQTSKARPIAVDQRGATRGRTPTEKARRQAQMDIHNRTKAEVMKALQGAISGGGGGGGDLAKQVLAAFPTQPNRPAPRVPLAPVPGNPYAGTEAAINRFVSASRGRTARQNKADRKAMKGRADPGAAILGNFDSQLAGQAAETAAHATNLRFKARQAFGEAELERQSALGKAKFDQQSSQMKADMEAAQAAQLSLGMIQSLTAEGLDPSMFMGNPMAAAVALGRLRYGRRQETKIPATAYAQAAQYGLRPPTEYGSYEEFQWNLGQARSGQLGGGDAMALLQVLQQAGLLKGLVP